MRLRRTPYGRLCIYSCAAVHSYYFPHYENNRYYYYFTDTGCNMSDDIEITAEMRNRSDYVRYRDPKDTERQTRHPVRHCGCTEDHSQHNHQIANRVWRVCLGTSESTDETGGIEEE